MFQLDKKVILIILVVIIVIVAGAAVAMLYKPATKKTKAPEPVEKDRVVPAQSGWMGSPDAGGEGMIAIEVPLNNTELTSLSVNITIKDDDGEHSQTDEGSDPDKVQVNIGDDTFEMATEASSGEVTQMKEYGAGDVAMFSNGINITITGTEFGGGKHPTGPGGIIPIIFLVYIDQGCAYMVEIKYTYLDYGGAQPDKDSKK